MDHIGMRPGSEKAASSLPRRYGFRLGAAVIGLGLLGAAVVEANAGAAPSTVAGATLTAKTVAADARYPTVAALAASRPAPRAGARSPGAASAHPGFPGHGFAGGGFPGGGFPDGGLPGGGFPGGGVVGTVASVNGSEFTVTVTLPATSSTTKSTTVNVVTSSTTTFEVESTSSLSAVAPGDTVVVRGTRSGSGALTASQITILPASSASGAGGWGPLEGTVSTVTAGSLTIKTASGSVTVATPASTKVDTITTATASSLADGDQVIVAGARPASPSSGSATTRSINASRVLLATAGTTLSDPAGPGHPGGFGAGPGFSGGAGGPGHWTGRPGASR